MVSIGRRFAGAGLRDAENIAARQHVGNCLFLDGSRGGVTGRRYGGENLVGQSEI
jgi:hypothetical protein